MKNIIYFILIIFTISSCKDDCDCFYKTKKICICNYQFPIVDSLVTIDSNSHITKIEYTTKTNISYVREFYLNKKIKSESFWINNSINFYKKIEYDYNGNITENKEIDNFKYNI